VRFKLKILDRYIVLEFLGTLLGVLAACAVVLLITKIFEDFDDIAENRVPLIDAAKYFLYTLPFRLLEVVPLATVLAVIFSIGTLARNREILAITSSGRSPYRTAAPVLCGAVILTFLVILLNETLVPYCQEKAWYFEKVKIKGRSEWALSRRRDIFDKGVGNLFFAIHSYDARRKRMEGVLLFEQNEKNPTIWKWSLKAKSAQLIKRRVKPERDLWRFENAIEYFYDDEGRPTRMVAHTEPLDRPMEADLDQYLRSRKEPEQMNLAELGRYIRTLKMRGQDVSVYLTDWYLKLIFPFSIVILATIAFALAARAHIASLPMAFGVGIFLTILFYALAALGQALGHVGVLPPLVGALGPQVVFLALGAYLVRRSGFAA